MWENLLRVDWKNLHHAYGRADDAPARLWHMVSADPQSQLKGWEYFWVPCTIRATITIRRWQ